MEEIEKRYKPLLPLPNPDVHEVIAQQLNLPPSKVFFGINLIRQKMKLPKVDYPKRKLAVTPDQLMAIEALYLPYLPVPPLGIHKIISKQLKIDEWRVHVAIGLIRKSRNMGRWNEEREDLTTDIKKSIEAHAKKKEEEAKQAEIEKAAKAAAAAEEAAKAPEGKAEEAPSAEAAEPTPQEAAE